MSNYIVVHGISIAKDFTPETFGRLTTIGPMFLLFTGKRRRTHQVCECACGNVTVVQSWRLKSGRAKSCGCYNAVAVKLSCTTHGLRDTPEYRSWAAMAQRCNNPKTDKYKDYGGRGIQVCDRWMEVGTGFTNYYSDMGPRPSPKHSIDRIDNNGNYCPENCRWATQTEQNRNQRNNRLLTFNGKTQCVTAWAEETGINRDTIDKRLKLGWTVEDVFTTPVRNRRKK